MTFQSIFKYKKVLWNRSRLIGTAPQHGFSVLLQTVQKSCFVTRSQLQKSALIAGIGRITKHLLTRHFETVDLVEQDQHFLEKAREYLRGNERVGTLYCAGLQNFEFTPQTYDVIWCQWVLGHLIDAHLVRGSAGGDFYLTYESGDTGILRGGGGLGGFTQKGILKLLTVVSL